MTIKLSEWAKQNGVTYRTAWNWFHQGKMPCAVKQTATGTILVDTTPFVESSEEKTKSE